MEEKELVNGCIRDICLSMFRGQWTEYSIGPRIVIKPPDILGFLLAFYLTLIVGALVNFIIHPIVGFFTIWAMFLFFVLKKLHPGTIIVQGSPFSAEEELFVTEFQLSLPELSHAEIQLIKKIRLSLKNNDGEHLAETLTWCRGYSRLGSWPFIEWLTGKAKTT